MADYLTNLVQRLAQQAQVVRARPLALFEPQKQVHLSPWAELGGPAGETGDFADQPGALQAGEAPAPPAVPAAPPRHRAAVELRSGLLPARPGTESGAVEAGRRPQPGYLLPQPAPEPERKPEEPPGRPAPGPAPVEALSLALEEASRREPVASIVLRPAAPSPQPEASPSIRPRRTDPATPFRGVPGALESARSQDHSPAEPVINVTIGRVEVIAMPPSGPSQAPPASRKSPVINLEEYLKSRDQERQS